MPNFLIDEDTDLLAAEFVLGTLDAEERANAQSLLRVDHSFIAMVRIWERRLSELHLMVEPVEPDPKILERIKARLAELTQAEEAPAAAPVEPAPALTDPAAAPAPAEPEKAQPEAPAAAATESPATVAAETPTPPVAEASEQAAPPPIETPPPAAVDLQTSVEGIAPAPELRQPEAVVRSERGADRSTVPARPPEPAPAGMPDALPDLRLRRAEEVANHVVRSRRRWRAFSVILLLLIGAVAALLGAWKFAPERVPPQLRPAELMTDLGISSSPAATPAPTADGGACSVVR